MYWVAWMGESESAELPYIVTDLYNQVQKEPPWQQYLECY